MRFETRELEEVRVRKLNQLLRDFGLVGNVSDQLAQATDAATAAAASAQAAFDAADGADVAHSGALQAFADAQTAFTAADAARDEAVAKALQAATYASNASAEALAAAGSATISTAKATEAGVSASSASAWANLAYLRSVSSGSSANASVVSAQAASVSSDAAGVYASAALTSELNAATSAGDASSSASAAATSASSASSSSTSAGSSASAAAASALAAAASNTSANTAATAANSSAVAANASAATASSQATLASTYATNASNSASAASSSATAASGSATSASGSAATATTQAGLSATYAGNASTSATNASTSATNASASAAAASSSATAASGSATSASGSSATATSQAALASGYAGAASTSATNASTSATNASASASSASSSALLAASAGPGLRNKNPVFSVWSNSAAPPDGWGQAYGSAAWATRIAGDIGGYAYDVTVAAGQTHEIGYGEPAGSFSPGWYVIELEIEAVSGNWGGGAARLFMYDSGGTPLEGFWLDLENEAPIGFAAQGATPTPRRYSFRKLVQFTNTAGSLFYFGASGGGVMRAKAATGRTIIRRAGFRPATAAEVRDQTVLAPLEATVATQASVISDHTTKLAAARLKLVALASGGAPAVFELYSDNAGSNFAAIKATQLLFGDNTVFNDASDVLLTTIGTTMQNAIAWGTPFGASADLLQWVGPTGIAIAAMTKANAYFFISTTVPRIGGTALATATTVKTSTVVITSQSYTSPVIQRRLSPGQSLYAEATIRVENLLGTTNQSISLGYREVGGGSFTSFGTAGTDSGSTGDDLVAETNGAFTNGNIDSRVYEIAAITSKTGSTGTVAQNASFLNL